MGVISSFLGIGGAWLVTPALNLLGMPMPYAIGTDITHVAGKSLFAIRHHIKLQNVDYKLALMMVVGTLLGIEGGAQLIMRLEKQFMVDAVVTYSYIGLLAGIFLVMLFDLIARNKDKARNRNDKNSLHQEPSQKKGLKIIEKIQNFKLSPMIYFPRANVTRSFWLVFSISLVSGFAAGFLGIGGGLIRFFALVYLIGCPPVIAVGTDLFEVVISGIYGAFTYSMKGRVDWISVLIMLCGAFAGTKIGALTTSFVHEKKIRFAFMLAVLGCLISVSFKALSYKKVSLAMIFMIVGFLALYILMSFLKGKRACQKQEKTI